MRAVKVIGGYLSFFNTIPQISRLNLSQTILISLNAIIFAMQEDTPAPISPTARLLLQAVFIFFSGLFLFLVFALSSVLVDQVWHAGRVKIGRASCRERV